MGDTSTVWNNHGPGEKGKERERERERERACIFEFAVCRQFHLLCTCVLDHAWLPRQCTCVDHEYYQCLDKVSTSLWNVTLDIV